MDSGEPLPFFELTTPSPAIPAWLVLKTGYSLIPIQVERTGDARYRTISHKPVLTDEKSSDHENILQVTAAVNRLIEGWIRCRPETFYK